MTWPPRILRVLALALVACVPVSEGAQDPDALAARAAQGATAMEAGRFDQAAAIYEEVVSARPGDAGLLMNLGMARYMAGRTADAVPPLQKAVKLQPGLAPASLFLGASLLDLGRTQEAVAPLERAVRALPQHVDAREMLARANLELERYVSAAGHYDALTKLNATAPGGWYGRARSYEGVADEYFSKLQALAPDSPLLELLFADVLVIQQKYPEALTIYRRALDKRLPVGGIHEAIGDLYERARKPDWAATERQKAAPRSQAECVQRPAECEFLAGRFRQALAAGRKSTTAAGHYWTVRAANALATESLKQLESLPPSRELHLIRAEIAQSRGRNQEAVTELRSALALAPGDPSVQAALAETLLRMRSFDEALSILEPLTRAHPDNPQLLFLHGDTLLQAQQVDRAIPFLEQAVKADATLLAARASLGRAYVLAGRYDAALPHLRAASVQDENGDVHYQLARAYQALQRPEEAQKALEEYQKRTRPAESNPEESGSGANREAPALTPP